MRSTIVIVLCCALGAATAFAEPPIPLVPELTDAVTLRYQYAPDTSNSYRIEVTTRAATSDRLSFDEIVVDLTGALDLRVVVQSLDADGNGIVYQEASNVSLRLELNGANVLVQAQREALEGMVRQVKLTVLGEVLDEQISGPAGEGGRTELSLMRESWDWFRIELPQEVVSIGDSWEQSFDVTLSGVDGSVANTSFSAEFTFIGYAVAEGVTCAVFQGDLDMWVEVEPGSTVFGFEGPALGRGTGGGYYYFDAQLGRLVQGFIDFGMVMQRNEASSPFDYLATTSLNITLR
jgi:hypothetical protein